MAELTEEGALLVETFGTPLVAYLCAASEDDVRTRLEGETSLRDEQEQVLVICASLARQIASEEEGESGGDTRWSPWRLDRLSAVVPGTAMTVANSLRQAAGGEVNVLVPDDPVGGPLTLMLADAYPLLMGPFDPTFGPMHTASFASPHRIAFETAFRDDPDLSRLLVTESGSTGAGSMVFSSTGSGGSFQLWGAQDSLITSAWWEARLQTEIPTRDDIATCLLEQLDRTRAVCRGETVQVPVRVALAGAVFDEDAPPLELSVGRLRPVTDADRRLAPSMLEGQVATTHSDGSTVTASYAGDLILETESSYRIEITEHPHEPDIAAAWPTGMRDMDALQAKVEAIRVGAMLGSDLEPPLSLLPTWTRIVTPLSRSGLSWSDVRHGPALLPRRLERAQSDGLIEAIDAVATLRHPGIDVALRRTVSATATRTDPADSLLDCVIALENLLGSREGEPTLRVAASVAWLLGERPAERASLRQQASRLYAKRSDVVHGNRGLDPNEANEAATEARHLLLAVLRKLFLHRPELLGLPGGGERSNALLLDLPDAPDEPDEDD